MKSGTLLRAAAIFGLSAFASLAFAQECEITVDSNDAIQYDTKAIEIDSGCDEFTVNLTHSGQLDKTAMGHNWVLSKAEDLQGIAQDGIAAGLENNYLKPNDERVIAATEIIGGGEKTSVTFAVDKLEQGNDYMFFCSFPGHSSLMQGTVTLK
ncbi:azurin [Gilvimarinus sp. F26214L]|uniref:azurin n=1 Tax=Gilvimarinus sp. DZF01 TaxID=3461371 RepID=UPI0040461F70